MVDPTTIERLKGLVLSAKDLRDLTNWPSALIEDYLNILDNIITLANLIDVEIDQKIEEIPTDFADGSVPFAESELLVEDNANFFWDIAAELLKLKALILNDATASRLLATDATKKLVSVAALIDHGLLVASGTGGITPLAVATNGQLPIGSVGADPVLATLTGTANQITIANAAGSITFSIPDPLNVPGDLVFVGAGKGLGYGSLYAHDAAINIDISGAGQGVHVKVTGLTTGLLNNVSINSDAFNVDKVGVYKVDWQISGDSQGTGKIYDTHIFVNGVEQDDGSAHRAFGAVGSLGSFSGTAILDITDTGHDIDLRIEEPGGGAGTDIDLIDINFNVIQIGGT